MTVVTMHLVLMIVALATTQSWTIPELTVFQDTTTITEPALLVLPTVSSVQAVFVMSVLLDSTSINQEMDAVTTTVQLDSPASIVTMYVLVVAAQLLSSTSFKSLMTVIVSGSTRDATKSISSKMSLTM